MRPIYSELEDAVTMRIQALLLQRIFLLFGCRMQVLFPADSLHRIMRIATVTEYTMQFHKDPTFSFAVYCCTQRIGWRSQRQSEKVNIRNACFLHIRAKGGRFCVLMNGPVFRHRKLLVFRTAATVHPPHWQNGGPYPPDLTVTDRLLVPANAKAGSAARSPLISRSLAEGITGHTQHFAAAEFSGLCPPPSSRQEYTSHAASY